MSTCEETVLQIAKKVEKMVQGKKAMDGAVDLLEGLSRLPITVEVLTKTRIGMTINELRKKTDDEKVAKRAKALIKEWKVLLDGKGGASNGKSAPVEKTTKPAPPVRNNSSSASSSVTSFPSKPILGDDLRVKSVNMLASALRSGDLPDGTLDPDGLATQIEATLFEIHRSTNSKYMAAFRSRIFNLRDKKNPALRENVLTGVVAPDRFARMTSDEMASAEMKEQREKFTKQAISEHQMAVNEGTPSDMFKCGKCGKKNCTYSQMQTRSADEPMTTFVYCRECGNRWKFC